MPIGNITGAQSIIQPAICTSATRPASPYVGQVIFETDTSLMKVWLGSAWSPGFFHGVSLQLEYLVIAGGGGGGNTMGGGGGAGGYRNSTVGETSGANSIAESRVTLFAGTYPITVGGGGAGATSRGVIGSSGSNSVFHTITSIGGGAGGSWDANAASVGGSGGGAPNARTVGAGTANQGFSGGGAAQDTRGGGGGGAGGTGFNSTSQDGGVGLTSSITGTATFRAGGGGAGGGQSPYGAGTRTGGNGGGGTGGNVAIGGNGTANTGGGAGGGGWSPDFNGGTGGSGIVIVRYLTSSASGISVSGGTATTSGAHTIRTFTASGSLVIA